MKLGYTSQLSQLLAIFSFCLILIVSSCNPSTDSTKSEKTYDDEVAAILSTLNEETKAAFERNYEGWQSKWVHNPDISKSYLNFADSSFSESIGWGEIDHFVKTYFEEHPAPEPLPEMLEDISVKLYGNGAWVVFEQQDSIRGLKRETRLMEKVEGEWKIAGMSTSIYGFKEDK
ncbi:MAG: hypothetical protein MRZ79_15685 [Bacteroidia bacterium]|nr:hypothetical protein [Bacteroidia bacterium]